MLKTRKRRSILQARIGLDLGNILIDHNSFGTKPEHLARGVYENIPPVKGAIEGLQTLLEWGVPQLVVVYNATLVAEELIQCWIAKWAGRLLRDYNSLRFVRSSKGRDKTAECINYQLNIFMDDRAEVLVLMKDIVELRVLMNSTPNEVEQFPNLGKDCPKLENWSQFTTLISHRFLLL